MGGGRLSARRPAGAWRVLAVLSFVLLSWFLCLCYLGPLVPALLWVCLLAALVCALVPCSLACLCLLGFLASAGLSVASSALSRAGFPSMLLLLLLGFAMLSGGPAFALPGWFAVARSSRACLSVRPIWCPWACWVGRRVLVWVERSRPLCVLICCSMPRLAGVERPQHRAMPSSNQTRSRLRVSSAVATPHGPPSPPRTRRPRLGPVIGRSHESSKTSRFWIIFFEYARLARSIQWSISPQIGPLEDAR